MTLGIPEYFSAAYNHHSDNKPAEQHTQTIMPCGFESEPLDFDSAFSLANGVSDWPSLRDPTMTLENRSPTIDSGSNTMTNSNTGSCGKRKALSDSEEDVCDVKRARTEDSTEDENTPPGGDDLLLSPVRRKGPQLWSPKLRWKDERKRVLKISMNKLRTIEDPEMFLRRSVLINNTMKRLQKEIREEKTARHTNALHDPFASSDGFSAPLMSKDPSYGSAESWTLHNHQNNNVGDKESNRLSRRSSSSSEGASCDEIFGVNEDYLRINLPERIPSSDSPQNGSGEKSSPSTPSQSCVADTPSNQQTVNNNNSNSSTSSSSTTPCCPCTSGSSCQCSGRVKSNPRFYDPPVSRCCSTQYRNGQEALYFGGDSSYCPHVSSSCVDSVIYHSLLASLES